MKISNRLLVVPALAALVAAGGIPAPSLASDLAPSSVTEPAAHGSGAAHAALLHFLLEPVADPAQFEGKRIAIVASDGASAFELETTRDYFMDRGARVHVLAPRPTGGAPMVGLAGFVPPREFLETLDYAGGTRLVAVTWYLDQVRPLDYDAIYVPNNLTDIARLGTNGQTIRFLMAAEGARRPIFATGNGQAIVPGLAFAGVTQPPGVSEIYAGRDAFDMPRLIDALAAVLAATRDREIN